MKFFGLWGHIASLLRTLVVINIERRTNYPNKDFVQNRFEKETERTQKWSIQFFADILPKTQEVTKQSAPAARL